MKSLVIGAAGGFGGSVAKELVRRGHDVRAVMRPGGRKPELGSAVIVEADALDARAISEAARGRDAIVFGFHVPYPKWDPVAIEAVRVAVDAASEQGATLLFPGNVYNLGPDFSAPVSESAPRRPRTELGAIRERMEQMLQAWTRSGARAIVLRAGDYFGAGASNSWFDLLTSRAVSGGRILNPAPPHVPHAWAYVPDLVRAAVDVLERRSELDPFEIVHFPGYALDSQEWIDLVRAALGDPQRKVWSFPWWAIDLAAPFSPLLRKARTMRYLWQEPVLLDGHKFAALLPDFVATPVDQAVRAALSARASSYSRRSRSSSAAIRERTSEQSARSS